MCTFLELEALERADVSDALAVALCHLNHGRAAVPAGGRSVKARGKTARARLADKLTPSYRRPEAG